MNNKKVIPFILSLVFSHGSGVHILKNNRKAFRYLLSNILLIDVPVIILIISIVINHMNPEFFTGSVLTVTEYIVNGLLLIIVFSFQIVRFLECRDVLKLLKSNFQ